MVLDNDTRGWIMTCVSAIACVFGSSIICVDLIIQRIPGKRHFRIQDSNTFLSSSLSLTCGVMLFSSLYSILPAAKNYFIEGGLSPQGGAFTVIGCFLGGVVSIQAVSRLLHRHMPSHVVHCDNSHDEEAGEVRVAPHDRETSENGQLQESRENMSEVTPLLSLGDSCTQDCDEAVSRSPPSSGNLRSSNSRRLSQPEESALATSRGRTGSRNRSDTRSDNPERNSGASSPPAANTANDPSHRHHHHIPTNTFLAIGLQTSIAIALHKLPEGFITFATNHANPQLGFSVFMALFIHNITEGFALALPLFLALNSRWKSMLWSSLLGGVSQPLGAGVAALWFKLARRNDMAPGDTVYGCMFAITAGVMTSVALQLFSESIGFTHNKQLCVAFVFLGMGILGVSFALTAR